MPIKAENVERYPPNWAHISETVRREAGWCCEGSPAYPDCRAENGMSHPVTRSMVVLTVGHLDHNPENCERGNLKAWCQRCHLTYDAKHHAMNAAHTRRRKKGNGELFEADATGRLTS